MRCYRSCAQKPVEQSSTVLHESPRKRAANVRAQTPTLLKGLIFGPTGRAMSPTHKAIARAFRWREMLENPAIAVTD